MEQQVLSVVLVVAMFLLLLVFSWQHCVPSVWCLNPMIVLVPVVTVMVEDQLFLVMLGEQQAYPYGVPSY